MTRFEVFRMLHILGAIAWVGAGIGLLTLTRPLVRGHDYAGMVSVGRQAQALGTRLFIPAALVTVGFGVALVATEPVFSFTDLWILIGLGGIAASGVAQSVVTEPATKRFTAVVSEHGTGHPELATLGRRITFGSSLDVGLLLVVVWAMIAKPSW
jgi:uncharacterized membrane protein